MRCGPVFRSFATSKVGRADLEDQEAVRAVALEAEVSVAQRSAAP